MWQPDLLLPHIEKKAETIIIDLPAEMLRKKALMQTLEVDSLTHVWSFHETYNAYVTDLTTIINHLTTTIEHPKSDTDIEDYKDCRWEAFAVKDMLNDMNTQFMVEASLCGWNEWELEQLEDRYDEKLESRELMRQNYIQNYPDLMPASIKKAYRLS